MTEPPPSEPLESAPSKEGSDDTTLAEEDTGTEMEFVGRIPPGAHIIDALRELLADENARETVSKLIAEWKGKATAEAKSTRWFIILDLVYMIVGLAAVGVLGWLEVISKETASVLAALVLGYFFKRRKDEDD